MKPIPQLKNDFILNDQEYQVCKTWLKEANEQTILHPLEDAELETDRRRMKAMVEEYETNWRSQVQR
jgi:hypothetical protein